MHTPFVRSGVQRQISVESRCLPLVAMGSECHSLSDKTM